MLYQARLWLSLLHPTLPVAPCRTSCWTKNNALTRSRNFAYRTIANDGHILLDNTLVQNKVWLAKHASKSNIDLSPCQAGVGVSALAWVSSPGVSCTNSIIRNTGYSQRLNGIGGVTHCSPRHIRLPFPNGRKYRFICCSLSGSAFNQRSGWNCSGRG